MKLLTWALAFGGLTRNAHGQARNHEENDYYVLHLSPGTLPEDVASHFNLSHEGPLGEIPDHHVFHTIRGKDDIVETGLDLRRRKIHKREPTGGDNDEDFDAVLDGILFSEKQRASDHLVSRAVIPDYDDEDEPVEMTSRPVKGPNWKPTFDADISSGGKDWRPQPHIQQPSHWQRSGDDAVFYEETRDYHEESGSPSGPFPPCADYLQDFSLDHYKRDESLEDDTSEEDEDDLATPEVKNRGLKDVLEYLFPKPTVGLRPTKKHRPPVRSQIIKKFNITDPVFPKQWNLHEDRERKHTMRVAEVWYWRKRMGEGVRIAIVDDGVDARNHEFQDRFALDSSWNFVEGVNDPSPPKLPPAGTQKLPHGTRSAGVAVAGMNGKCGVGVAPKAEIAGIRILGKERVTAAEEAEALSYKTQENDIYSCAWGPKDDGKTMAAPSVLVQRAMHHGVMEGRGGKGSIYVFAAGNGGREEDNCNFDGYANSIYTITIASVKRNGQHPPYGEKCAANLISAFGSGDGNYINTVDLGGECWPKFGGTSSSAPQAAGMIAIALQSRPDLTWRDMQHIAVESAVNEGIWHSDRQSKDRKFSHKFGFGRIDARKFIQLTEIWKSIPPQSWWYSPVQRPYIDIPRGGEVTQTIEVNPTDLYEANFHDRLEHVTLTVSIEARRRGDISIDLISPSGTKSHMARGRKNDDAIDGFRDWTFMSVANWGERASGKWKVIVKDKAKKDEKPNSLWVSWSLQLYGSVWDVGHVKPLPMPGLQSRENMNHTTMVRDKSLKKGKKE